MNRVHGNKKDPVVFFKRCKKVIEILGVDFELSENQKQELIAFFEKYNDGDRSNQSARRRHRHRGRRNAA